MTAPTAAIGSGSARMYDAFLAAANQFSTVQRRQTISELQVAESSREGGRCCDKLPLANRILPLTMA